MNKLPPHDIETEKSLLCCIMIDEHWYDKLEDVNVKAEYFYNTKHKKIFEIIDNLYNKSIDVNFNTIKEGLTIKRLLEEIPLAYIANIYNQVSTSIAIVNFAKIVKEKFMLRKLISIGSDAVESAYMNELKAKDILRKLDDEVYDISTKKESGKFEKVDIIAVKNFKELEKRCNSKEKITGLSTGYKSIDNATSGFCKNKLMILAARPGTYKTAFVLEFAHNSAKTKDKANLIFSLEMEKNELMDRLYAKIGSIEYQKIRNGKLEDDDWYKLQKAIKEISEINLHINDSFDQSLSSIRRESMKLQKSLQREGKSIGVVFIDYLGLMELDPNAKNTNEALGKITRGLKKLAKDLKCSVKLLCQLNRECEKRPDKRPILSDLRDSGSIEQDADLVGMLYFPQNYGIKGHYELNNDGSKTWINYPDGYLEYIIVKQRGGYIGTIKMIANGDYQQIFEVDENYGEN